MIVSTASPSVDATVTAVSVLSVDEITAIDCPAVVGSPVLVAEVAVTPSVAAGAADSPVRDKSMLMAVVLLPGKATSSPLVVRSLVVVAAPRFGGVADPSVAPTVTPELPVGSAVVVAGTTILCT